jgi:hypothetical protein
MSYDPHRDKRHADLDDDAVEELSDFDGSRHKQMQRSSSVTPIGESEDERANTYNYDDDDTALTLEGSKPLRQRNLFKVCCSHMIV